MKKYISNAIISIVLIISTLFLISLPIMTYAAYNNAASEIAMTLREFKLDGKLKPKTQDMSGPCWAFAAIATIEASLAKKGMLDAPLSEKHLLNWAYRRDNESGYHLRMFEGASLECATGYLLSGEGPYKESQCPYAYKSCFYTKLNENPLYTVKGSKRINTDISSIKEAIAKYGAVCVGYEPEPYSTHAVCIIGWNDRKRMWLVKDSGIDIDSENKSDCFKWLSFDTKIHECYAYTDIRRYNPNEKIYQYDETGAKASALSDRVTCANVFSFGKGEVLNSVTLESDFPGAKCDIYLAQVDSTGRPSANTAHWKCVKSGAVVPHRGYFTVDTANVPVQGKMAVVVDITGKGPRSASIGYTRKVNSSEKLKMVSDNKNSYRLVGGRFLNPQEDSFAVKENLYSYSIKAVVKK